MWPIEHKGSDVIEFRTENPSTYDLSQRRWDGGYLVT